MAREKAQAAESTDASARGGLLRISTPEGQRPHPWRTFGRRRCPEDATDHDALGEHVVMSLSVGLYTFMRVQVAVTPTRRITWLTLWTYISIDVGRTNHRSLGHNARQIANCPITIVLGLTNHLVCKQISVGSL
jgi:hypothetical protein